MKTDSLLFALFGAIRFIRFVSCKKKAVIPNGGITAFFPLSASLRWNYPNRFGGSPYPVLAG
jgi:hypothetical protein